MFSGEGGCGPSWNMNGIRMVIINDLERISLLIDGKMMEARSIAGKNYNKRKKSNRKKIDCDAELCLIFPIDMDNDWDQEFECKNGCKIHIRCEGLVPIEEDIKLPENYICKSCEK